MQFGHKTSAEKKIVGVGVGVVSPLTEANMQEQYCL